MAAPDDTALAARWDELAAQWADNPRHVHPKRYIAAPTFRALWGDIRGQRVLDAGCGGGWLTRLAAEDGALVSAVDFSQALIARAQDLDGGAGGTYHVANLCDLARFDQDSFDLAISHCCLQDVREYRAALREIGRVLRPKGRLILSVVHPGTWQFDAHWGPAAPGGPFEGRIEDPDYLSERFSGHTMFHRPISAYSEAITDAGLCLLGLYEPRPGDELAAILGDDPRWERWRRVPDFLFVHASRQRNA